MNTTIPGNSISLPENCGTNIHSTSSISGKILFVKWPTLKILSED